VIDSFIEWLAATPPGILYAVLIVLSALENVFPPVPADVAVALGAFLSHRGVTSAPLVGVLCWAANAASASGMYFFARAHKDFVRRGWPSRILTPEAMVALEKAYERHGTAGIFLSRFLPGIRAAVTPFAGVVGLSPVGDGVPNEIRFKIHHAGINGPMERTCDQRGLLDLLVHRITALA
jgi:membrane protein DedA with SNARE-associated domain